MEQQMKITFYIALVSLLMLHYSGLFCQTGETRTPGTFTKIVIETKGDVTIVQDDRNEIIITSDRGSDFRSIATTISGSTLYIYQQSFFPPSPENVHYTIHVREIEGIMVTGSADVKSTALKSRQLGIKQSGSGTLEIETLETEQLNLNLSGSGECTIEKLKARDVRATVSGSGDVTTRGETDLFFVKLSGSGRWDGEFLQTDECYADLSDSGELFIEVNRLLDASISGSGTIYYKGAPEIKRGNISGSGTLTPLE